MVREIHSRQVFITGNVDKPGAYPLNTPMTVIQVIASAGGLKEFVAGRNIIILRHEGGREVRLPFDYQAVDVESAEPVDGSPHQPVEVFATGDVDLKGNHVGTVHAKVVGDPLQPRDAARAEDKGRPTGGQQSRNGLPYAAAGAGDGDDGVGCDIGHAGTTAISAPRFRDHSRVRNAMSSWNWSSMSGSKSAGCRRSRISSRRCGRDRRAGTRSLARSGLGALADSESIRQA